MNAYIENLTGKAIAFYLGTNEYLISVDNVIAIERMNHITRIPNIESYIKGVINLRGIIIPIIDLKERFGLGSYQETEQTRVIIVTYDQIEVGFIVDAANDVLNIDPDNISEHPEIVGEVAPEFIDGIMKLEQRLLILLNLSKVLQMDEGERIDYED